MEATVCKDGEQVHSLNQKLQYEAVFAAEIIHGPENKGVEVGVAPSVIIFKDPPEDYVVPNPGTLGFTELEV